MDDRTAHAATAGGHLPSRRTARPEGRLDALFREAGTPVRFRQGATLALHGSPVGRLFRIDAGTVRCCTITEEGRRQIFRFVPPGEAIGLVESECWHFTAEAVDAVLATALPREALEREAARDPALGAEVRARIVADQMRLERQLVTLSWLQAADRVLWFLSDFAALSPRREGFLVLPMTRQEIGDHLGLSLETVSRCFGALRKRGLIEMRGADRFRLAAGDAARAA